MKFQEPKTKPYCDLLKYYIVEQLKYEFAEIFLSHNLIDTMEIKEINEGYIIDIPAEVYDIDIYRNKKVIVYTGEGSYADEVDISGGFSGLHKNYVDRAVSKSIKTWRKWLMAQKLFIRRYKDLSSAERVTLTRQKKYFRSAMQRLEQREEKQKNLATYRYYRNLYKGKKSIRASKRSTKVRRAKRG